MLADFLTMHEASNKPYDRIAYAFTGDCRFNMGRSLLVMGALMGSDVRLAGPAELHPPRDVVELASGIASRTGARITVTEDPAAAVSEVDFIHTDVWVSMGEPKDVWAERVKVLTPPVNAARWAGPSNPANVKFMHLPARVPRPIRDRRPEIAGAHRQSSGSEVTVGLRSAPASCSTRQKEPAAHHQGDSRPTLGLTWPGPVARHLAVRLKPPFSDPRDGPDQRNALDGGRVMGLCGTHSA
jgi:ornithine carbamoyltransferase